MNIAKRLGVRRRPALFVNHGTCLRELFRNPEFASDFGHGISDFGFRILTLTSAVKR
jgi:hypothetical protein